MPFDGSGNANFTDGTRTGRNVWVQDRAAAENVNAPDMDAAMGDICDMLQMTLLRTGVNSPTADLPFANRTITGIRNATANQEPATLSQLNALTVPFVAAGNVGGTASAVTLTVTPSVTYAAGKGYRFIWKAGTNTGAVTLQEGSQAAVSMRRIDGNAFEGGELENGMLVEAIHNGTNFATLIPVRQTYLTQAAYTALSNKRDGVLYGITG